MEKRFVTQGTRVGLADRAKMETVLMRSQMSQAHCSKENNK